MFNVIFLHAVAPKYNLLHAPGARPRRYDAALVLRSTLYLIAAVVDLCGDSLKAEPYIKNP